MWPFVRYATAEQVSATYRRFFGLDVDFQQIYGGRLTQLEVYDLCLDNLRNPAEALRQIIIIDGNPRPR